jgi:6-pyruvoyltetrahydropterin/6-carboxytetrahydropterin synthase
MSYRISKTFTFAAAHRLPHLAVHHKCRRPHGHNYTVTLVLQAEELDTDGFVEDYGELNDVKQYIDAYLDHQDLNTVWTEQPTTAEVIARSLYERFHAGHPALIEVVVSETSATTASYRP